MADLAFRSAVFAAALGSGLVAGVFFAFSSFVMPALGRLAPAQGVTAMQSINLLAVTPAFTSALFGTAVLSLGLAIAAMIRWQVPGSGYVLAGGACYLAGAILVTMLCNVPRNNALAALDPAALDAAAIWPRYVMEWTYWNHVRGVAAVAACACFILALI